MAKILLILLIPFFSFAKESLNLEKIIKKYSNSKIEFKQISYIKELNEKQEFEGILYLKSPKFKVVYTKPYKQVIFSKENKIFIYSPDENQVIITDKNKDLFILTLVKILSGKEKLSNYFYINKKNETYVLTAKEKFIKKFKLKKMEIGFNNNDIEKIIIYDTVGNKIIFKIINANFEKSFDINYILPKDVEVINY